MYGAVLGILTEIAISKADDLEKNLTVRPVTCYNVYVRR